MTPATRFLVERSTRQFQWGEWDCIQMVGEARGALGLTNPAAPMRGEYSSAGGALRLLAGRGGIEALIDAHGTPMNRVTDFDIGVIDQDATDSRLPGCAVRVSHRWHALAPVGWRPVASAQIGMVRRMREV